MQDLKARIAEIKAHEKRVSFSLENGRGQTYNSGKPTLYAHSTYPRGSVLAGRPKRMFIDQFDSADSARKALKEAKVKFDDMIEDGGSSHIPVDQMVSHLPDDSDY